jgi:hypothetical protein
MRAMCLAMAWRVIGSLAARSVTVAGPRIADLADLLGAFGHVNRLQPALLLVDGTRYSTPLAEAAGMSPALAAHHLGIMVRAGIARRTAVGLLTPSSGMFQSDKVHRALFDFIHASRFTPSSCRNPGGVSGEAACSYV